jgi:hypothetical protein
MHHIGPTSFPFSGHGFVPSIFFPQAQPRCRNGAPLGSLAAHTTYFGTTPSIFLLLDYMHGGIFRANLFLAFLLSFDLGHWGPSSTLYKRAPAQPGIVVVNLALLYPPL